MEEMFPLEAMGETGENVAERWGVSREDQDAFALASQQRWAAAAEAGRFDDELVPVGDVTRDEHPRPDTTLEKLAALKPAFRKDGTVTAGNSSGINDGAAALVIASEEKARELGIEPLGTFVGSAAAGVDPRVMGIGPIPAVQKLLARTGVDVGALDLVELNEAFASQSLAVMRELGLDPEKVNVNGGAIALGHPLGMSGARLVVSLLHELRRRDGRYGLATLCVGVGQGQAALFERAEALHVAEPNLFAQQGRTLAARNEPGPAFDVPRRLVARARERIDRALTDGRADVDHVFVLRRHEGGADAHDHALDVGEDLVGRLVVALGALDGDAELVDRLRLEAGLLELPEQPVTVRDPCCFDLDRVRHRAPLVPCSDPIDDRSPPLANVLPHLGSRVCASPAPASTGIFRFMAVATGREHGLFINGETVEPAAGRLASFEPATGSRSRRWRWPARGRRPRGRGGAGRARRGLGPHAGERALRLLHALADAIAATARSLPSSSRATSARRSRPSRRRSAAVENFRFFASVIGSIAGRSNPVGGSLLTYSLKEPVGVAAQIVPWNYPLLMATWKLSPALAAGCSVVLKPDPQTPLSVLRVAELATEVGFPPARSTSSRRRPDDRRVSRQASRRRQGRVHRLDEDGRRDHAALLGADQAAHARARRQEPEPRVRRREPRRRDPELGVVDLLLRGPELRGALARARRGVALRRVRRAFADYAKQIRVGDPLDPETQMGSLISTAHRDRVHGFVERGIEEGAEVVTGGEFGDGKGAFYQPTVLAKVDNAMESRRRRSSARSSP